MQSPDSAASAEPARPRDLGPLLAGDQPPAWDLTNPEHQRRVLELAGLAPRPWAETERKLAELAEDQREAEAEARGYRPLGWLRRAPW